MLPRLALALLIGAPLQALAGPPADPQEALRDRLAALLAATRTASWTQSSWERAGDRVERSTARCLWAGPARLRLDLTGGRGAGGVAVVRGDEVLVRPPVLGFLKLRYRLDDGAVRSLRGHDLARAGFFDDLAWIVERWSAVTVEPAGAEVVLSYLDRDRLPARLWLDPARLSPVRLEVTEAGEPVERVAFADVRYDVPIAADRFSP